MAHARRGALALELRRFLALTRVSTTDGTSWTKTVGPLRTLLALAIFRVGQPALSLPVLVLPVVSAVLAPHHPPLRIKAPGRLAPQARRWPLACCMPQKTVGTLPCLVGSG